MGGYSGDVDAAGGDFDEEQYVQRLQPQGFHREEVGCEDADSLTPKELRPGGP